ncbi:MAG: hypothetical protein OXP37_02230 [Chloroflexota bacterium]|nr:hypothetical protein [Chloroflexota bacterium]
MFESLEFIQDHKIWLQGRDANFGQDRTQPSDKSDLTRSVAPGDSRAGPPEPPAEFLVFLPEFFAFVKDAALECIGQVIVDPSPALEFRKLQAEIFRLPNAPLEEVHGAFARIGPYPLDHVVKQDPFGLDAHAAFQVEGSAWGKRQVVHPVILQAVNFLWQQPQPPRPNEAVGSDPESANVLPGNLRVGTDVDDVDLLDSVFAVPEMVKGLGDYSAGNQRLPEANFVGDQKSTR